MAAGLPKRYFSKAAGLPKQFFSLLYQLGFVTFSTQTVLPSSILHIGIKPLLTTNGAIKLLAKLPLQLHSLLRQVEISGFLLRHMSRSRHAPECACKSFLSAIVLHVVVPTSYVLENVFAWRSLVIALV